MVHDSATTVNVTEEDFVEWRVQYLVYMARPVEMMSGRGRFDIFEGSEQMPREVTVIEGLVKG
jgi:hypothetical protein